MRVQQLASTLDGCDHIVSDRTTPNFLVDRQRTVATAHCRTEGKVPIVDRSESSEGSEDARASKSQVPEDPGDLEQVRPLPTQAEVEEEIGREILSILAESYGRGAGSAEAIVTEGWVIVILDDLELLPNERFLVERGKRDAVAHVRSQYQHAIRANFSAAIERATGRNVIGFTSATSVEDPAFMAEVFKLE